MPRVYHSRNAMSVIEKIVKYEKMNLKNSQGLTFCWIWRASSHGKTCQVDRLFMTLLQKELSNAISCHGYQKLVFTLKASGISKINVSGLNINIVYPELRQNVQIENKKSLFWYH